MQRGQSEQPNKCSSFLIRGSLWKQLGGNGRGDVIALLALDGKFAVPVRNAVNSDEICDFCCFPDDHCLICIQYLAFFFFKPRNRNAELILWRQCDINSV